MKNTYIKNKFVYAKRVSTLLIFILYSKMSFSKEHKRFDVDSLCTVLTQNEHLNQLLNDADSIYAKAGIDPVNISPRAFKIAYVEKCLVDERKVKIPARRKYKNNNILTVIDFTKDGNKKRLVIVDLAGKKILYDTLVAQGSGKGERKNDKKTAPGFFSNKDKSECTSLGLILTTKSRQPEDPCHYCKYSASVEHNCTVLIKGLESDVNDNIEPRSIVIHTTGSQDYGTDSLRKILGITDANYKIKRCDCYKSDTGSKIDIVPCYATDCGISENNGYIGQSNGCFVLPEDSHIKIMQVIEGGSLIFSYSDIIDDETNYFEQSPIIRQIIDYARN